MEECWGREGRDGGLNISFFPTFAIRTGTSSLKILEIRNPMQQKVIIENKEKYHSQFSYYIYDGIPTKLYKLPNINVFASSDKICCHMLTMLIDDSPIPE